MRVMVVVPPLAERQQRHPPVVRRIVARLEAPRSPLVGRRVHEPGGVQTDGRAEKDSPEHVRDAAVGEEPRANEDVGGPVPPGKRDVDAIASQIRYIAREDGGIVIQTRAAEDPAGVGPPRALSRRMRIALAIRVLVVDAMRGHPEDWTAL